MMFVSVSPPASARYHILSATLKFIDYNVAMTFILIIIIIIIFSSLIFVLLSHDQVPAVTRTCFYRIRNLCRIRPVLDFNTTRTVGTSFVH